MALIAEARDMIAKAHASIARWTNEIASGQALMEDAQSRITRAFGDLIQVEAAIARQTEIITKTENAFIRWMHRLDPPDTGHHHPAPGGVDDDGAVAGPGSGSSQRRRAA